MNITAFGSAGERLAQTASDNGRNGGSALVSGGIT
jgi:hypothetical protein